MKQFASEDAHSNSSSQPRWHAIGSASSFLVPSIGSGGLREAGMGGMASNMGAVLGNYELRPSGKQSSGSGGLPSGLTVGAASAGGSALAAQIKSEGKNSSN